MHRYCLGLAALLLLSSTALAIETSTSDINVTAGPVTVDASAGTITPSFNIFFTDILNQTTTTFDVDLKVNGTVVESYTVTYEVTQASSDCVDFGDPQATPSCQGGCGKNGNQFLACAKINKGANSYECACNGAGELPPHGTTFGSYDVVEVSVDPGDDFDEWDEADNVVSVTIP